MKATVKSDLWFLRLRSTPERIPTNIKGAIRDGATIEVLQRTPLWSQVKVLPDDLFPTFVTTTVEPVTGWVVNSLIEVIPDVVPQPQPLPPVPPAPNAPVRRFLTGVNCNAKPHLTSKVFSEGCRFALVMDNFLFATQLKDQYPDAIVMVRRYLPQPGNVTGVGQALDALEGANDPDLIYTLFCEGADRPLEAQIAFEIEVAKAINAKFKDGKLHFAAGTFAMGNPDFTNPSVVQAMKAYAPAYNAGILGLDMHLYSPNLPHIDKPAEWKWLERRWEFLFTDCGFDPKVRAIFCSETGEDEGGLGGFAQHGRSASDVAYWVNRNRIVQELPLVVNGVSYPSPILGGAIFQLGNDYTGPGGWAGYNIEGYTDALKGLWTV